MGGSPLDESLKVLSPIESTDIPQDENTVSKYLHDIFHDASLLVDSVPLPPPASSSSLNNARSATQATCSAEITLSDARPEADPAHEKLQKAWGKPVRLAPKDNPLGMSVYKLAGNDGKGAWFARRSVHEGLGFSKWKKALQSEFAETLKVQGGPGEGNIRGIGGEKRLMVKEIVGDDGKKCKLEVWDLTAQFPGPTTPREFVEAVATTDCAFDKSAPRHFMIVSIPCKHPDAPEREGFIRGQYQSVEFIREVPSGNSQRKKSVSDTDLSGHGRKRAHTGGLGKIAAIRNAEKSGEPERASSETRQRQRSKTAGDRRQAQAEDVDEGDDSNPVEWIMLTRSDPGGSVPRFMVERGTPGSIVADAAKFLDWACSIDEEELQGEIPPDVEAVAGKAPTAAATGGQDAAPPPPPLKTENGQAGGPERRSPDDDYEYSKPTQKQDEEESSPEPQQTNSGFFSIVTSAASLITSRLPSVGYSSYLPSVNEPRQRRYSTSSSSSSEGSFASAIDRRGDIQSESDSEATEKLVQTKTGTTDTTEATEPFPVIVESGSVGGSRPMSVKSDKLRQKEESAMEKLERHKRKLSEKLNKIRHRELSKSSEESASTVSSGQSSQPPVDDQASLKSNEAVRKAEERYAREVKRQEEKFAKEMERLRARRERDSRREVEKMSKNQGKSETETLKKQLERERTETQVLRVERELLRKQVGELQRENTRLALGVGRLPGGEELLKEVRAGRDVGTNRMVDEVKRERAASEAATQRM